MAGAVTALSLPVAMPAAAPSLFSEASPTVPVTVSCFMVPSSAAVAWPFSTTMEIETTLAISGLPETWCRSPRTVFRPGTIWRLPHAPHGG